MNATVVAPAPSAARSDSPAIRPFTYRASQAELDELHRRVLATRLPEKETEPGQASGVPLATVQKPWKSCAQGLSRCASSR